MRLALFQPDIPQNTGAIIRLTACFGIPLDIIEPCGFILSDAKLRRSGMDYLNLANIERHISWDAFIKERKQSRLVLITTRAEDSLKQFTFDDNDTLILGRESSGVPQEVTTPFQRKFGFQWIKRLAPLMFPLRPVLYCGKHSDRPVLLTKII